MRTCVNGSLTCCGKPQWTQTYAGEPRHTSRLAAGRTYPLRVVLAFVAKQSRGGWLSWPRVGPSAATAVGSCWRLRTRSRPGPTAPLHAPPRQHATACHSQRRRILAKTGAVDCVGFGPSVSCARVVRTVWSSSSNTMARMPVQSAGGTGNCARCCPAATRIPRTSTKLNVSASCGCPRRPQVGCMKYRASVESLMKTGHDGHQQSFRSASTTSRPRYACWRFCLSGAERVSRERLRVTTWRSSTKSISTTFGLQAAPSRHSFWSEKMAAS